MWTGSSIFLPFRLSQEMNIRQYVHIGHQFLLCIAILRADLLWEHPQVSSLITGVFTNRPSRPKYNFTWDVQLVLDYLKKELSNNSNLSEKLLIFKVAMLLTLTSVFRVRGLHILDTRFMVKTLQKYVFNFHKPHKSWKQGQKVWSACRVILILWIKPRKDLILSSHPLHENYSTVTCIFSFV